MYGDPNDNSYSADNTSAENTNTGYTTENTNAGYTMGNPAGNTNAGYTAGNPAGNTNTGYTAGNPAGNTNMGYTTGNTTGNTNTGYTAGNAMNTGYSTGNTTNTGYSTGKSYYAGNPQNYSNYYTSYNSASKKDEASPKKKSGIGKTILKTVCIAIIFGLISGGVFAGVVRMTDGYYSEEKEETTTNEPSAEVPEGADITEVEGAPDTAVTQTPVADTISNSIDVSSIAASCMPSVISITTTGVEDVKSMFGTYSQEFSASGSGIIIGENDTEYLIVTNNHVISGAQELTVCFSFDEAKPVEEQNLVGAKVKGSDPSRDLAVISVDKGDVYDEQAEQIVIASVGDSSALKVGEQVVAIGNSMGYGQSVTTGIISAMGREVEVQNEDGSISSNVLIQTDAAINPGNSGGALINMNGQVIGINAVKYADTEVEGMGYAIPISDVEGIIGDLMNKTARDKVAEADRGYMGIKCVDVTQDIADQYGDMPIGIYISEVTEGSAAEQAGLQKGDILIKFDGTSVSNYAQLKNELQYYAAGETVTVVIYTLEDDKYVEKSVDVVLSGRGESQ